MREIKFRAWDAEERVMHYNSEKELVLVNVINDKVYVFHSDNIFDSPHFIDRTGRVFPMQYTGLKDKNGRDVYEGDIGAGQRITWGTVERFVVEWDGTGWKPFNYHGEDAWGSGTMEADKSEVVGNIYENPELVEAKE